MNPYSCSHLFLKNCLRRTECKGFENEYDRTNPYAYAQQQKNSPTSSLECLLLSDCVVITVMIPLGRTVRRARRFPRFPFSSAPNRYNNSPFSSAGFTINGLKVSKPGLGDPTQVCMIYDLLVSRAWGQCRREQHSNARNVAPKILPSPKIKFVSWWNENS